MGNAATGINLVAAFIFRRVIIVLHRKYQPSIL